MAFETRRMAVARLDGSARAEQALHVVTALARGVLCNVTLLRVIDAPEHGPAAERYLVEVVQRVRQDGLACQYRVERGDPATTIIDTAGTDKLIVMATHGRSGLTRWALGSVADRVVHGGVAGLLLVRAGDAPRRHHQDGGGRGGHVDRVLWDG